LIKPNYLGENLTQEIDFDKGSYSMQSYFVLNDKEYFFDNDLINIMSIAVENEDFSVLNKIDYYQYFLSTNRVL
jgi:hypothetical protein